LGDGSLNDLLCIWHPPIFQELLHMRRSFRAITPDNAIKLPGAGCWNSGCIVF
jgi:hypothetical protein